MADAPKRPSSRNTRSNQPKPQGQANASAASRANTEADENEVNNLVAREATPEVNGVVTRSKSRSGTRENEGTNANAAKTRRTKIPTANGIALEGNPSTAARSEVRVVEVNGALSEAIEAQQKAKSKSNTTTNTTANNSATATTVESESASGRDVPRPKSAAKASRPLQPIHEDPEGDRVTAEERQALEAERLYEQRRHDRKKRHVLLFEKTVKDSLGKMVKLQEELREFREARRRDEERMEILDAKTEGIVAELYEVAQSISEEKKAFARGEGDDEQGEPEMEFREASDLEEMYADPPVVPDTLVEARVEPRIEDRVEARVENRVENRVEQPVTVEEEQGPVAVDDTRPLDSQSRLRRADLSESRIALRQQETSGRDARGRQRASHYNRDARRTRAQPGDPDDGDDSSSDDSFLPENLPGLPPLKKKKKGRRDQSPPAVSFRPRVNTKYYVPSAVGGHAFSTTHSASAYVGQNHVPVPTLTNNAEQYILQVLETILNVEPEDLPMLNKNFKPTAPKPYGGEDNNELFYQWIQNNTRYYWLMRMVGQSSEELRIFALGESLTGLALEWYNTEVTSPSRERQHWTFVDIILELHNRFVHHATVQLATEKFDNVEYKAQKGVAGLYSEMLRYAKQMVEYPGDYYFRRKFLKELPEEISLAIMRNGKMTAENSTIEQLLQEALAIESADKTAKVFQRMRNGRGNRQGEPSRNTTTDTPRTGKGENRVRFEKSRNKSQTRSDGRTHSYNLRSTSRSGNSTGDRGNNRTSNSQPYFSGSRDRNSSGQRNRGNDRREPTDKGKEVDMSKVRCYKCSKFGHYASAHDKPGFRAMDVHEEDVEDGEEEEQYEDALEGDLDREEREDNPDGSQYDSIDDLGNQFEEMGFEESADERSQSENEYFAPMRLFPREGETDFYGMNTHPERMPAQSVTANTTNQEQSRQFVDDVITRVRSANVDEWFDRIDAESLRESVRNSLLTYEARILQLHGDLYALRLGIDRALQEGGAMRLEDSMLDGLEMNRADALSRFDERFDISYGEEADELRVETTRTLLRDFIVETVDARNELHRLWRTARQHYVPIEVMDALEDNINGEQERTQQWSVGMEPLDGDQDTVEGGRYNYLRELLRRLRLNEENTPDTGNADSDDMPELETVPPESPRAESPDYFALLDDDNSIDFETAFGMRLSERGEKLFSVEEVKGQRAAMRVTGKAKPRPTVPSKCITIEGIVNGLRAVILLDTGSSINAMSPSFALLSDTEAFPLDKPIGLQLGCVGSRSKINYGTEQALTVGNSTFKTYFDIVNLDHYDVVLGIPFMRLNNVVIDFTKNSIRFGTDPVPPLEGEEGKVKPKPKRATEAKGKPSTNGKTSGN